MPKEKKRAWVVVVIIAILCLFVGLCPVIEKKQEAAKQEEEIEAKKEAREEAAKKEAEAIRLDCATGFRHLPFKRETQIVIPPGNCWTEVVVRPNEATWGFEVEPLTTVEVEFFFRDGKSEIHSVSPIKGVSFSNFRKKVTGVRFRSGQEGDAKAIVHSS